MWVAARNKLICLAFIAKESRVRLGRWLLGFVRPQLGAIDHVTIPVRDLALARRFYCGILGADYFMQVDDETFRRFGRPPPGA